MSKGASLAPQEMRMDFAVLPETKSQGLFHQIQKEVTFCGLLHGAYKLLKMPQSTSQQLMTVFRSKTKQM
jgi:hypothetical protein